MLMESTPINSIMINTHTSRDQYSHVLKAKCFQGRQSHDRIRIGGIQFVALLLLLLLLLLLYIYIYIFFFFFFLVGG